MMDKSYPFVGHLVNDASDLPVSPPVTLLGRDMLLKAVSRQLDANGAVLLYGVDGIGKTTIAAALAALLAAKHAGGALWIHAGSDDLGTLCDQVGQAFRAQPVIDAPSLDVQIERTKALLTKQKPLIVLDDFTNDQAARDFVRKVISGLPTLLTTTEALAGPWTPVEVKALDRQAGVKLFYTHSGLTPAEYLKDITALCDHIDQHPLSIQLAARLVATDEQVIPGALLAALPSRYDLPPGANLIQAILRALFKRLSSLERTLMMVLGGTFAGGGTSALLSDIAQLPAEKIDRAINRLEARGLINTVMVGQYPCISMHHLVYTFAVGLMESSGRLQAAQQRTVDAVAAYVAGLNVQENALRAEWGNIIGALAHAAQAGNTPVVSQIAQAVANSNLLTVNGHAFLHKQMAQVSGGMITLPAQAPPAEAMPTTPDSAPDEAAPAPDWPGAEYIQAGDQQLSAGDPESAIESYAQALQAVRQAGDPVRVCRVLLQLGHANDLAGHYEHALQTYRQALQAAQQANDPKLQAVALASIGASFLAMGELDRALKAYERVIPALQQTGQYEVMARTYNNLGLVYAQQDRLEEALTQHQHALDAANQAGDLAGESDALLYMGDIYRRQARYEEAMNAYSQVLTLGELSDSAQAKEQAFGAIGLTAMETGELEQAAESLAQAAVLGQELGTQERDWTGYLGQVYQELGRYDEAVQAYSRAVELARSSGDKLGEASYLNDLALILTWRGQLSEAVELYRQAVELAHENDAKSDEAVFISNLGMAHMDMGQAQSAADYFRQALDLSRELGDRLQEANALGNLGVAAGALRDWPQALDYHQQALSIWREADALREQGQHLGYIGQAQQILGQREPAIETYREALALAYRLDDEEAQATWLYNLGNLLMDNLAMVAEAVSMLEEALALQQYLGTGQIEQTQRHLNRATKRLDRARRADVTVNPAPPPNTRRLDAGTQPLPPLEL